MRRTLLLVLVTACSTGVSPAQTGGGEGGFPGGSGGAPASCDTDGDGWEARACDGFDCDDGNAGVHPGAEEIANGIDDDCDGVTDASSGCAPGDLEACWSGEDGQRAVGACRDGVRRCGAEGTWGACTGEVLPAVEDGSCDGADQDCDGADDGCSSCPDGAVEICGNGLDEDCDGFFDEPSVCDLDCSAVDPREPAYACCTASPPNPFASACADGGGLPACVSPDRACLDLDGDPATACVKQCGASGCFCGRPAAGAIPDAVPDCGFVTACARVSCAGKRNQPCYSGPPGTLGVGACHGGRASCEESGTAAAWGSCEGEVLPSAEICGNGIDDDCDGRVDDRDDTGRPCPARPACAPDARELCGNGLDDDCDGFADEGCPAAAAATQACWTGSLLTRGLGACHDGTQHEVEGAWGACEGEVLPVPEVCGDDLDGDCDGLGGPGEEEEPSCCVPHPEVCNGRDDDCDGLADEGVISRCGVCGAACYEYTAEAPSSCDEPGRTCENVGESELSAGAVALAPATPAGGSSILAFTQNQILDDSVLVLLDTASLSDEVRLQLPFTAADVRTAADGTIWVAGNATGGGTLLHLDRTGRTLCRLGTAFVSQFTVDSSGDVWAIAGTFQHTELSRISGSETSSSSQGDPVCKVLDLTDEPGTSGIPLTTFAQLFEDENHWLWVPGTKASRLDLLAERPQLTALGGPDGTLPAGGILGRDGGLYAASPARRFDLAEIAAGRSSVSYFPDGTDVAALATALDDGLWGVRAPFGGPPFLVLLDPSTVTVTRSVPIPVPAFTFNYFDTIAVDRSSAVWLNEESSLWRFDALRADWTELHRTAPPRLYPGSMDRAVRELARHRGRWAQVIDSGSFDVRWAELSWCASTPAGSRVVARARFADAPGELAGSSAVCGPFETSPADLSSCSGGRRVAQIEFSLSGHGRPSVGCIHLSWDRK